MVFAQDPEYRWHDCNLQTYKIKCNELTTSKINYSPIRTFVYEGTLPNGQTEVRITSAMLPPITITKPSIGKMTVWMMCTTDTTQVAQMEYIVSVSGSSFPYLIKTSTNTRVGTMAAFYAETRNNDRSLYFVISSNNQGPVTYKIKYEGF